MISAESHKMPYRATRATTSPRPHGGFTLIEMLVVIMIIGLLGSILLPALSSARKKVQRTVCASHMNEIGKAVALYLNEYNNRLPNVWYKASSPNQGEMTDGTGQWWVQLNEAIIKDSRIFSCPSAPSLGNPADDTGLNDDGHGFDRNRIDYGYNDRFLRDQSTRDVTSGTYIKFRGLSLYRAKRPTQIVVIADATPDGSYQAVVRQVDDGSDPDRSASYDLGEDKDPVSEGDDRVYARHSGRANILYLDGHVAPVNPEEIHERDDTGSYSYSASITPTLDAHYDFRPWCPKLD